MRLDKIGLEHNLPDCEHRQTKNGPKNRWMAAKIKYGKKSGKQKMGQKNRWMAAQFLGQAGTHDRGRHC